MLSDILCAVDRLTKRLILPLKIQRTLFGVSPDEQEFMAGVYVKLNNSKSTPSW